MIQPDSDFIFTTYLAFKNKVRGIVFPEGSGEAEALAHDNYIKNALIRAQRYVACLRETQASFFYSHQMHVNCGVGVLNGPRGVITAVYAFKPNETDGVCRKFFMDQKSPEFISCWSNQNECNWKNPDTTVYQIAAEALYPYYESGEDEPDTDWKCTSKFFGREGTRLYLAPRLPSGYILAVHWNGINRRWEDTDAILDDTDLVDFVAAEVEQEIALRLNQDRAQANALSEMATQKLGDLQHSCNEERYARLKRECSNGIDPGNLMEMFPPIYDLPTVDAGGTLSSFSEGFESGFES